MIPSWAKRGAKVICVDDAWDDTFCAFPLLKGGIYTVDTLFVNEATRGKFAGVSSPTITLIEAENPDSSTGGFKLARFRPVHTATESEDLAAFRHIADLAGVDEALRRLEGVE